MFWMALTGTATATGCSPTANRRRDERTRPPYAVVVGDVRDDACRARIPIDQRADEGDLALCLLRDSAGRDRHRLANLDRGQVRGADRHFDPDAVKVHDYK